MPIIALFDKKKFHLFAGNTIAQAQMNEAMIRECKLHGYTGFQFDFENIDWIDRDRLNDMVKTSAEALHKAGLQLTIATVPNAPGYPGAGGFAKCIYTDWRGAYDIAAIAKYVDLLCLMTYDQHTRWTMPGRLSLVHRDAHQRNGTCLDKPNPTAEYIGTPNALQLAEAYKGNIRWDSADRTAYFYFYRDQMREWIFFTDLRTFKEHYQLVEKNGLQGFCSWVLGQEDPAIWNFLPKRH